MLPRVVAKEYRVMVDVQPFAPHVHGQQTIITLQLGCCRDEPVAISLVSPDKSTMPDNELCPLRKRRNIEDGCVEIDRAKMFRINAAAAVYDFIAMQQFQALLDGFDATDLLLQLMLDIRVLESSQVK